ncbi:Basic-leucine zipper domain-containing protein [Dioscorea alata]|uniref:Basic-leucine zipper domain-containing protein n=1 Tax=Dioscorea alata TaxID=55571 RepID=A0ACB7VRG0_DIOAL|nr:Basic-leucine zipper domain-containing protein [Dioscorea alata]
MAGVMAFDHSSLSGDPFDSSLFDLPNFPSGEIPLPDDFSADLDLDPLDFDFDFSVEDLLQPSDDPSSAADESPGSDPDPDPDPDPNPASAVSSSSSAGTNTNPPSPDSGQSGVTSRELSSEGFKRKERDIDNPCKNPNPNPRSGKLQRSEDGTSSCVFSQGGDDDEKKKARLMRNRESAQLSRQRKKHYVEELEDKLGGNAGTAPPMAVYPPMAPMHFPWIPCGGYAMRPNGSQVPLVPIPRLKTQQAAPAPKAKGKSKKVASISFLGLLFIMFIAGVVVPQVSNLGYGVSDMGGVKGRILGEQRDRNSGVSNYPNVFNGTEEVGTMKNSSESLPAFLYVPRNGKHVKINGNLIIHSFLAGEKAMKKARDTTGKDSEETGLAIAGNVGSALAISEHQRAIGSNSKDHYGESLKRTPGEGPLQQWFREGLAGPILNSGMCTEVFQFEVSPSSVDRSGIVPATAVANATSGKLPRGKKRNRRTMYPYPIPLSGSTVNNTESSFGNSSDSNVFGNKSVPSMVVSILADPKEAGDGDGEGMISPKKSLSRIFVVVLMDSVKYVTYSCVLPRKTPAPHLVN